MTAWASTRTSSTNAKPRRAVILVTTSALLLNAGQQIQSARTTGTAFVDVAEEVGLSSHRQHRASGLVAPNCIFDEPFSNFIAEEVLRDLDLNDEKPFAEKVKNTILKQLEARDIGGFCLPERFTGGAAVGDLNNDGWDDIVLTSMIAPPSLFLNIHGTRFASISAHDILTPAPPSRTNGVALFDANNDGLLDVFFTTVGSQSYSLYVQQDCSSNFCLHDRNNTLDGNHEEISVNSPFFIDKEWQSSVAGASTPDPNELTAGYSISVGDYDHDGWLDLFVGEWRFDFLRGDRETPIGRESAHGSKPEEKGKLDHWTPRSLRSDSRLFRNTGNGIFEDATQQSGLSELVAHSRRRVGGRALDSEMHGPAIPLRNFVPPGMFTFASLFQDLDDDGFLDLIIAADFGTSSIWWNDGHGHFFESTAESGMGVDENGMGLTVGDIDGDGDMDVFISGIFGDTKLQARDPSSPFGFLGNVLYVNAGNHSRNFSEQSRKMGLEDAGWGWGAAFTDVWNRGGPLQPELIVANGLTIPETTYDDTFWNLNPTRLFSWKHESWHDISSGAGVNSTQEGRGVVIFDWNKDGKEDILIANHIQPPHLYENVVKRDSASAGVFVRVAVKENCGRDSIGARVELFFDTQVQAWSDKKFVRFIGSRTGFLGQSSNNVHFGLGDMINHPLGLEEVTIQVRFPDRSLMEYKDLSVENAFVTLRRDGTYNIARAANPMLDNQHPKVVNQNPQRESNREEDDQENMARSTASNNINRTEFLHRMLLDNTEHGKHLVDKRRKQAVDTVCDFAASRAISAMMHLNTYTGPQSQIASDRSSKQLRTLRRHVHSDYADGKQSPSGAHRPSARVISNALHRHKLELDLESKTFGNPYNQLFIHFGQFLSHDLSHTPQQANSDPEEFFPIQVFEDDEDGNVNGISMQQAALIRFRRSVFDPGTQPREQLNKATPGLDASALYGNDEFRTRTLRQIPQNADDATRFKLGALRTSSPLMDEPSIKARLPLNHIGIANDNPLACPVASLHVAGDSRANIQPGLTAMHTLFVREHNWWARKISRTVASKLLESKPDNFEYLSRDWIHALDNAVFNQTRVVVEEILQSIVYNEYLPLLLGKRFDATETEEAQDDTCETRKSTRNDIGINNIFSTAAFRLHPSSTSTIKRITSSGEQLPSLNLNHESGWFMPASELHDKWGGVDHIIRGAMVSQSRPATLGAGMPGMDMQLRNRLLGKKLDLLAINIQRGRDHGLPNYLLVRQAFGLPASYAGHKQKNLRLLQNIYKTHADDIDAYVGMLLEKPKPFVGETAATIISEQFQRLHKHSKESSPIKKNSDAKRALSSLGTMMKLLERNLEGLNIMRQVSSSNAQNSFCHGIDCGAGDLYNNLHRMGLEKSAFINICCIQIIARKLNGPSVFPKQRDADKPLLETPILL